MIQGPYHADVEALFGRNLWPVRFPQEAVKYIVRVRISSGHRPIWSNGRPGKEVPGNVELDDCAVPIAHKAVIHVRIVNEPARDRSIRIDIPRESTLVEAGSRRPEHRKLSRHRVYPAGSRDSQSLRQ